MFELKTERLRLIPLSAENLKLSIENHEALERKLGLEVTDILLEGDLKNAMLYRLGKVLTDEENYVWYTNWEIVSKEENRIVGGIMVKGVPNDKGEVIIGYYTLPEYQGKGYMTETIIGLSNWMMENPKVLAVVADTEKGNISSHRVLEKVGMEKFKETDELYYWRIIRK